ncbi:50S ribosomal protein L11 methyltransferase [Prosthecochloris sp. HL-130-GSB]|uniref:50S ribosomal protein L11 methyltransferase n=1 Tax=Prosthecochloris sp. HL-130-GSB TaxID=1974213 RepID=UPI000A1C17F4|nr:50S ribosomal protein L11 methyltransferase [Prosthecochloris sp. HL-130-GSB]ARM31681.1 50S ribosomal protein L11 methyltransferase [Prosthecochloris sp. HL-130-GSB]
MATSHDFIELELELTPDQVETCIGHLSREGIEYFQEEDNRLLAYLPEAEWSERRKEEIVNLLSSVFGKNPLRNVRFMADRNWNAEWEAHLQPIEISDRIAIVQKNKEFNAKPGQIVIEINPKMSFGTGYHATTRLMLRMMESMDLRNLSILDIGTGTGVLAIAARKLGNIHPILGVDNNDWAAENARENVIENNADRIRIEMLDAEDDLPEILATGYDLILANINKNVIDRVLPAIRNRAPDSRVLISGIMIYDESWLKKLLKTLKYRSLQTLYEDEWLSTLVEPVA